VKPFTAELQLLNKVQNAEVSDTTGDAKCTEADNKNLITISLLKMTTGIILRTK